MSGLACGLSFGGEHVVGVVVGIPSYIPHPEPYTALMNEIMLHIFLSPAGILTGMHSYVRQYQDIDHKFQTGIVPSGSKSVNVTPTLGPEVYNYYLFCAI